MGKRPGGCRRRRGIDSDTMSLMKIARTHIIVFFVMVFVVIFFFLFNHFIYWQKQADSTALQFDAPGRSYESPKKVEDYFVETLRWDSEDLAANTERVEISFYVTEDTTLEGILNNLEYYGFVRDGEALRYTLQNTSDTTSGQEGALKAGNGDIDIKAYYRISEDMNAFQIANILLNNPNFWGPQGDYGYLFMP